MKPPFYVAEYIRLSREDGDKAESDSVGNQRKLIRDYVRSSDDFVLYDTYVDDGFTGTNFARPAFLKMMQDIEDGRVNCVVVKDLSRFGRDYIDTGKYLERYFPDHDIRFISITDHIDSMKQAYDMLIPIKNIFNEQYARDISKKVCASLRTKQKAGEFIGAFASYGYRKSPTDKNRLLIDEYAAGVVRRIFEMYLAGCGKNRIAAVLNQEGIVCPSEYKRRNGENYRNSHRLESTSYWTYSTVNRLLQNEMYTGNMVQGKKTQRMKGRQRAREKEDWIIVKGTHEAIIGADTWEKAQDLLKRRTRSLDLTANRTVFAGYLKCGDCGRSLVKKARAKGEGKDLENLRYYCGTYVRSGRQYCTAHPIAHSVLEKIVLDDLAALLRNQKDLEKTVKEACAQAGKKERDADRKRDGLCAQLEKIRKLKQSVYEDYRQELISKAEYVAYRQDYCEREQQLEKQLESLKDDRKQDPGEGLLETPWIKRLLSGGGIERLDRETVVEMIREIRVYESHKIEIDYNFSDEPAAFLKRQEETG